MHELIPLVYCFDENYARYAPVSLLSAKLNATSPLKVYCIALFSQPEKLAQLHANLMEVGVEFTIMVVDEVIFSGWSGRLHISKAAYLRLLIPTMVKEERVIYIDCDTMIMGDLRELYRQSLGENAIGGVAQVGGSAGSKVPRAAADVYINSGVLLMDLAKLHHDNFFSKCQAIYEQFREEVTWCDQCVINKYAENNKCLLDERWNMQVPTSITPKSEWRALLQSGRATVIHFVGSVKPWMEWCNPEIAKVWWSYANQLSFRDRLKQPFASVRDLIMLSQILDLNGDYQSASQVKSSIIANLLESTSRTPPPASE